MKLRRRLKQQTSPISFNDPNLQFTKAICAGWTSRIMAAYPRVESSVLELIFWLVDDHFGDRQEVLDCLLSKADQTRLLPEIKKAWHSPDEMANVVGMVQNGAEVGRLKNMALDVSSLLSKWSGESSSLSGCPLATHLSSTQRLFGFSSDEVEFAFFFSTMKWWEPVQSYFDNNLNCDQPSGRNALMAALDFNASQISEILSGKLFKIGVMGDDRSYLGVDSDFLPYFVDPAQNAICQDLFRQAPLPELSIEGLGLGAEETDYLKNLFKSDSTSPLNVLLYGPPGTGKSTLWKSLVSELNMRGFEVLGNDGNRRSGRRAALGACLEMVSGRTDSLMIVDEAETLLNTMAPWFARGESLEKSWVNELLEKDGLRCIWVVNSVENIDPAVLRRFTHSLEMRPLGWKKRGAMIDSTLRRNSIKRHFSEENIQEFSREFDLAPAVFDTAAKAAARVGGNGAQCRQAFRKALMAKSKLFGVEVADGSCNQAAGFLANGINPDMPLQTIESMVKTFDQRQQTGFGPNDPSRLGLLFYGPPGSGKSITARYLADAIERPVLSFKASDWLDPYVGRTEQQIAAAFRQVTAEGAVMVVDEIDTFLQARSAGARRWEISQVNELLVQIENHKGIIVCTTNRMDSIDSAALRRFPLKVGFDYLTSNQVLDLYGKVLGPLGRGVITVDEADLVKSIGAVTAADLFLVRNNYLLLSDKKTQHGDLIADLGREIELKREPSSGQVIGF